MLCAMSVSWVTWERRDATETYSLVCSVCQLCSMLQAQAFGLGCTDWFERRCSHCWKVHACKAASLRDAALKLPPGHRSACAVIPHSNTGQHNSIIHALDLAVHRHVGGPAHKEEGRYSRGQYLAGTQTTTNSSIGFHDSVLLLGRQDGHEAFTSKGAQAGNIANALPLEATKSISTEPRFQLKATAKQQGQLPSCQVDLLSAAPKKAAPKVPGLCNSGEAMQQGQLGTQHSKQDKQQLQQQEERLQDKDLLLKGHGWTEAAWSAKISELEIACADAEHTMVFGKTLAERRLALELASEQC